MDLRVAEDCEHFLDLGPGCSRALVWDLVEGVADALGK